MKLWLDDVRDPQYFGAIGWDWVLTAQQAIVALATGAVRCASLDHDLSLDATLGYPSGVPAGEETGMTVVQWMEQHGVYPPDGVVVHSMNVSAAPVMVQVLTGLQQRVAPTAPAPVWRMATSYGRG